MQLRKRARGLAFEKRRASVLPQPRPSLARSPSSAPTFLTQPDAPRRPSAGRKAQLHPGCTLPGSEETISSTLLTRFYPAASRSRLHPGEINATPRLRTPPAMARRNQPAVYRQISSGAVGDARRALARMEPSSSAGPRGFLLFASPAISFVPPSEDVTHLRAVNLGTPPSSISGGEFARGIFRTSALFLAIPRSPLDIRTLSR